MSHTTKLKTTFKDLNDLRTGVEALGGTLHEGAKEFLTYGNARQKCDHKISFPNAQYEVGVIAEKDGTYNIKLDFWSTGGLKPILGNGAAKLKMEYGVAAATRQAERKGFRVRRTEHEGRPRLSLSK